MKSNFAAIVLAAGEGRRMRSKIPKVLHHVAEKPIIAHTLDILDATRPLQKIVVVSPKNINLIKESLSHDFDVSVQENQLGTGDATRAGLIAVREDIDIVAVMYGDDTAFYKPHTIIQVFKKHKDSGASVTFVTLDKADPTGLGRIIRNKEGNLVAIVEEKDATEHQKEIAEINDGLYFFNKRWLSLNLPKIKPSEATGEYYVTELVKIALLQKEKVETYKLEDSRQWYGINTPEDLETANKKLKGQNAKKIHFMGAAGAGASAVMQIAAALGFDVSGCDLNPESSYTHNSKIKIEKGHSPIHLKNIDVIVVSPAIEKTGSDNPELEYAWKNKIPTLSWQKFHGQYMQKNKFVIAVAGAYGKSTTTAMIAKILIDAGLDPTCEIGANVLEWDTNFKTGKSKYYVCEADEYNDNFLSYKPDIAVILNIGWDHPDFFKSKDVLVSSYKAFIANIKSGGTLILPGSHSGVRRTIESKQDAITILIKSARRDIKIVKIENFKNLKLSIIGDFRAENANAALTVAQQLKIDPEVSKKSAESFSGLGRRLEFKGKIGQTEIYDDYAVQPYTALKTANALKEKFPEKKIALVFEPHTFSRINTFFADFVKSLKKTKADQVFITDVFPARESGDSVELARKLANAVGTRAKYTGSLENTANSLKRNLNNFDVILSMGAGNAYKLYDLMKG